MTEEKRQQARERQDRIAAFKELPEVKELVGAILANPDILDEPGWFENNILRLRPWEKQCAVLQLAVRHTAREAVHKVVQAKFVIAWTKCNLDRL